MARNRRLPDLAAKKLGGDTSTAAIAATARTSTITFISAVTILSVLSIHPPCLAQLKTTRQLTSNNVIALAGGGDTLWVATERGLNYRLPHGPQNDWHGFEAGDLLYRFWGLAFGGGSAAALIDKNSDGADSIGFWHFSHADGRQLQKNFRFPQGVRGDSALPVGGVIYSNGSFWAPFNYGGIVRYDPANSSIHTIRPDDDVETLPQNLGAIGDDADTKAVLMLDVDASGNSITVTTPSTLWLYHPADKKWDALHTKPAVAAEGEPFVSFEAAFTVKKKDASTLYSFITTQADDENLSSLCAFDAASNTWVRAIDSRARYAVFPAVDGCLYTLSDNNISLYADTSTAGAGGLLSVITQPADFREMLKSAGDDPNPKVQDILFLPQTDSSGTLAIATTTGLYVCDSVEPRSNKYGGGFTLSRYVRSIKSGEAYALPGVMRGAPDGRYEKSVFVYKLKKDGNVTIKVYDYNMSLVKTVVKNERRSAASARSTNPARDVWDGTNSAGKRVWPGVYYFKITSSGGDRLFGKVILAK